MNYTQEMNLVSKSGYCMPFEEKKGEVNLTLGYGKQIHPVTQWGFSPPGGGFPPPRYILPAVADGVVSGIGSTPTHGLYQVIRYGKYEVTYAHLVNALAPFGARVRAGSVVSISGDLLHIEVKYDGEEINPMEFLAMLYGNLLAMRQQGHPDMPELETMEMDIPTDYDDDREEIEVLMLRFYPEYLLEVGNGGYRVPEHTEQSLRNLYEPMPSLANPLGIGSRSMPIAAKVQNLLIGDFLNYLALRHEIFLSTLSENDKKKRQTKP